MSKESLETMTVEMIRRTGIDLYQTPLGPPSEKVFEWADEETSETDASDPESD